MIEDVEADRDAAFAEVDRLRAGEDPTPRPAGTQPTPGQWIYRWNTLTAEERLRMAGVMIHNTDVASACFLMDHVGRLEDLRTRSSTT